MCSLELIREEGAAKIPRQSWEAEGREGPALNSPSLGPLAGTGRAQRPKVGAQRQGESSHHLEGARIKEEPPQTTGWLFRTSDLSRFCATPGLGQMRGPQRKEEIANEKSEATAFQKTRVVGGWAPKEPSVNNSLLSTYTVPALSPCWPLQMHMALTN